VTDSLFQLSYEIVLLSLRGT